MREKTIAQKNAERIAPARVHSGLCPAALGLVHDVVVHERGDVDEFDDHGKIDVSRVNFASCAASQKRKKRSQTFTATTDGIGHIAFDVGIKGRRLLNNSCFNFLEMRLNQLRHSSQRAERKTCWRNVSSNDTRACENFHEPRIEGRLVCCQSITRVNFPGEQSPRRSSL